jgi:protein phosphatase methylesterase 1
MKNQYQIVSFDFKGHGMNSLTGAAEYCLSTEKLVEEVKHVLFHVREKSPGNPIILCGHSMGGAIAIRAGHECEQQIDGLIIIDVVEGAAIEALPYMD